MLSGDGRARARRSTTSLPAIFSINFGTWLVQNFRFKCIRIQSTSSNHLTLLVALASCSEPSVPLDLSPFVALLVGDGAQLEKVSERIMSDEKSSSIRWFWVGCESRTILISTFLNHDLVRWVVLQEKGYLAPEQVCIFNPEEFCTEPISSPPSSFVRFGSPFCFRINDDSKMSTAEIARSNLWW